MVELASRLAARGFVLRRRGGQDRREVLLALTPKGERVLRELSMHHREELRNAGPALLGALRRAIEGLRNSGSSDRKSAKSRRTG